ncbi:MAG: hypothetical protein KAU21_19765 [Gammaproteobacteria bacterium]|nr:hypothetical protein [Gammaproteobacteria bacterium]
MKAEPEDIKSYKWSEESIEFKHCNNCGCITHYETTEKVKDKKIVVNFRMADPEEIQDIKIRTFDGADTWKFLN